MRIADATPKAMAINTEVRAFGSAWRKMIGKFCIQVPGGFDKFKLRTRNNSPS